MAIELSRATYAEFVGRTFRVSREGFATVEMELAEVNDLSRPGQGLPSGVRQDPFQLQFRGPADPILPQGIYTFACGDAETGQLFLVPVGPAEGGVNYNVVVN